MKVIPITNKYLNTKSDQNTFFRKNITTLQSNKIGSPSFAGIKESSWMSKTRIEAAGLIKKVINEITSSVKASKESIEPLEGSYEQIGSKAKAQRDNIENNYFFTAKKLRKVDEHEIAAKQLTLLRLEAEVDSSMDIANANLAKANRLEEDIKKIDPKALFERQKFLRSIYPNQDKVGFEKIASYNDVKATLNNNFIRRIDIERSGQDVRVPGLFIFFGPTGNGKTTFANAVAEETGCRLEPVETGLFISDEERLKFMETLKSKAVQAEKRFKEANIRTILYIDELTKIIGDKSNILTKFEDFAKTCSEQYHCTIFGGTNHISKVGINIKGLDPQIISIDPPGSGDMKKILMHYLNGKTIGNVDYDQLTNTITKVGETRGGMYSNGQLRMICEESQSKKGGKVSQDDLIKYLKEEMDDSESFPAIDWKTKKNFDTDFEEFMT